MALKTTQSTTDRLDRLLQEAESRFTSVRNAANDIRARATTNDAVDRQELVEFKSDVEQHIDRLTVIVGKAGIQQRARDEHEAPTYAFTSETNSLITELGAVVTEIVSIIPVANPGSHLRTQRFNATTGYLRPVPLQASELTGLLTPLDDVIARIDAPA